MFKSVLQSARLERVGLVALLWVAVLLPFDFRKTPVFTLGSYPISVNLLVMAFVLLIWIVGRLRKRWGRWSLVHSVVLAWSGVILLSALCAEGDRSVALKAALGMLGGSALFFAAADLISAPGECLKLWAAIVLGAALSAAAAVAERWVPGMTWAMTVFKPGIFISGGLERISGPFLHPNTAAMYWEAALPLVLTGGVWLGLQRAAWRWAVTAVVIMLIGAIVLSLSRAGLLLAASTLSILLLLSQRLDKALLAPTALCLMALVALTLSLAATNELVSLRLSNRSETSWYQARYFDFPSQVRIEAGQIAQLDLRVQNAGNLTWPARGEAAVQLSYHWLNPATNEILVWEGLRTELPADVPPGAEMKLSAQVLAPAIAGDFILVWDLLFANAIWFSALGANNGQMAAQVLPPAKPGAPLQFHPTSKADGQQWPARGQQWRMKRPSRRELWNAALALWREHPLLGVGPGNFRLLARLELRRQGLVSHYYAHSLYFETLATMGLLGALTLITLISVLAAACWQLWQSRQQTEGKLLTLGLVSSLALFFIHGLVESSFGNNPACLLFWLTAAMVSSLLSIGDRAYVSNTLNNSKEE